MLLQVPNVWPLQLHDAPADAVQSVHWKSCIRLEFHGTHDETSHATKKSKSLIYKQITAIYDAVIVAPNQSATKLCSHLENAILKSMFNRLISDPFSGECAKAKFGKFLSVEWCPRLLVS